MSGKIKSTLALVLTAMTMISVISGCGSKSNSLSSGLPSTDSLKTTPKNAALTLWGSQDDQKMLQSMVQSFKETHSETNYTIKIGVCGENDVQKKVLQDVGAAADVFSFQSDQLAALYNAGALQPVTIDLDMITSLNSKASLAACTMNKRIYAYPSSADTYFLYYDKKYISDAETKSLESIMGKTLPSGVHNFAMNLDNGSYDAAFFLTAGCKLFGDDGTDASKCDFNSDKGAAAGEYMINLCSQKTKFIDFGTYYDTAVVQNFKDRKIASAVFGAWNAAKIREALGKDYGVAKLPTIKLNGKDTQMASFENFKVYGINAKSKYPTQAMELAEYLTTEENQKICFEKRAYAPTNIKLSSDKATLSENAATAAENLQNKYAKPQPTIGQMKNFWEPMGKLGTTIENGKTTKATLKKDLDDMVKSILAD